MKEERKNNHNNNNNNVNVYYYNNNVTICFVVGTSVSNSSNNRANNKRFFLFAHFFFLFFSTFAAVLWYILQLFHFSQNLTIDAVWLCTRRGRTVEIYARTLHVHTYYVLSAAKTKVPIGNEEFLRKNENWVKRDTKCEKNVLNIPDVLSQKFGKKLKLLVNEKMKVVMIDRCRRCDKRQLKHWIKVQIFKWTIWDQSRNHCTK